MTSEKEQLVDFVFVLMHEFGRGDFLESASREEWLTYPLSGIRQAANDVLEMSQDLEGKDLAKLDKKLEELNLPSLSNMRVKGYRELLTILSRNKIRNEDEWYVVKSYLDSEMLHEQQRSKAFEISNAFEFKST